MKVKKWYIIPVVLIIALMITNPSERSFGKYIRSNNEMRTVTRRKSNFILFSTFKAYNLFEQQEYVGILGFFIRTKDRTIF